MLRGIKQIYKIGAILALYAFCGLAAISCAGDPRMDEETYKSFVKEGEWFTTSLNLQADQLSELRRGIDNDEDITSLRVIVFDANKNFLYSQDAVLGSSKDLSEKTDNDFFPDQKKEGITRGKSFTVTLKKSSERRYVHFIANYDWTGFEQDYFITGTSSGELMPSLLVKHEEGKNGNGHSANENKPFLPMWSRAFLERLDEHTFNGKVIKLVRNYAKITVENKASDFKLEAFTVCNVPKQGTVVPFKMDNLDFSFPYPVSEATVPPGTSLIANDQESDLIDLRDGEKHAYHLFEWKNDGNEKTFVIVKGKRSINGTMQDRYYKIDLVKQRDQGVVGDYFPIVRNNHYMITINGVNSDGYATLREAIRAPAGNNLFSSIEMQNFKKVSDGVLTLSVDPITFFIVRPGTYEFSSFYSGGWEHTKYYPSWYKISDYKDDLETNWEKDKDPFMGELKRVQGKGFSIHVKEVPYDQIKEYSVEVVGLRRHGSTVVDATSGATVPLSRRVKLILRPPFLFHGKLEADTSTGDTNDRILSFDIPKEINKNLLPFDIYIKTDELTPRSTASKDLVLVYRDGAVYYRYTVRSEDRIGKRLSLPFIINNGSQTKKAVELSSEFYEEDLIYPETTLRHSVSLNLYYLKPDNSRSEWLPKNAPFTFTFDGASYSEEDFRDFFGGTMMGDTDGHFKLSLPSSFYDDYKGKDFTISAFHAYSSSYGFVKYIVQETKKLEEWMQGTSPIQMSLERVEIKGVLYHYQYSSNGWIPSYHLYDDNNSYPHYTPIFYANSSSSSSIAELLQAEIRYRGAYGYDYKLTITEDLLPYIERGLYFDYYKTPYGMRVYNGTFSNYYVNKLWRDLESSTRLDWYRDPRFS